MENVLGRTPDRLRIPTRLLESMPPERKTPTGTSLTQLHTHRLVQSRVDLVLEVRTRFAEDAVALLRRKVGLGEKVPIAHRAQGAFLPAQIVPGRQGGDALDQRVWFVDRPESQVVQQCRLVESSRN